MLARVLWIALFVNLAYVAARVPHSVVVKRATEIGQYRSVGGPRFHLDNKFRSGARWVEWILAHVPEDAVVLFRGEQRGALEFVPALVFPRLLVAAAGVPAGQDSFAGRSIARGQIDGLGEGQLVLVGAVDHVGLELR